MLLSNSGDSFPKANCVPFPQGLQLRIFVGWVVGPDALESTVESCHDDRPSRCYLTPGEPVGRTANPNIQTGVILDPISAAGLPRPLRSDLAAIPGTRRHCTNAHRFRFSQGIVGFTLANLRGAGLLLATSMVSLKRRPVIFRSIKPFACQGNGDSGKPCHSGFSMTALRASATVIMSVSGSTGEEIKPHFS